MTDNLTIKPEPVPPYLLPTALYRAYDTDGVLLYVGVSLNTRKRFKDHKHDSAWWPEVAKTTEEWYPVRDDAQRAEIDAILTENPKYNRRFTI